MTFKKFFAAAVCFGAFGATAAMAQLPAGSFGIGANISSGLSGAQFLYAVHPMLQLSINSDYSYDSQIENSTSNGQIFNSENNSSSYGIGIGVKVFFRSDGVLPFLNIAGMYSVTPKTTSAYQQSQRTYESESISADIGVGAQYFFIPSFAVHGQFGVTLSKGMSKNSSNFNNGLNSSSQTQETDFTRINFGNTSLGVSFYF